MGTVCTFVCECRGKNQRDLEVSLRKYLLTKHSDSESVTAIICFKFDLHTNRRTIGNPFVVTTPSVVFSFIIQKGRAS